MAECKNISSKTNMCDFITNTESCFDTDGLIHYLRLPYCVLPSVIPIADIILFMWLSYLFICLAVTAEDYFCPALTSLSKILKLSQNVAGVTLIALGNGSNDIFSCIVALATGDASTTFLAFGAMFGAGLFINTVVVGAVTISQDSYNLARRPFFRDCIFYLAAIYWTWYNCYNQTLSLATGVGYIVLYVTYVILVLVGRFVFQRFIKTRTTEVAVNPNIDTNYAADDRQEYRREPISFADSDGDEDISSCPNPDDSILNDDGWTEVPGIKSHAFTRAWSVAETLPDLAQISSAETPLLKQDISDNVGPPSTFPSYEYPYYTVGAFKQTIKNFVYRLNPLNSDDWDKFSVKDKIFAVLSMPANMVFSISIPVVDPSLPLFGWNKLLNALHLVTCPVTACFLLQLTSTSVGAVPVAVIAGCVGLLLMMLMLLTTSQGENPIYFKPVYTIMGFLMSIVWIYTIANEVVSLLSAFSHMFELINEGILGLTILSWANSLGDLVSDTAMAKKGYPQMAVSACIGGLCLNMLLGIGLASTLSIIRNGHPIALQLSGSLLISSGFLMLTICSHLVFIPIMNFSVKRWYGFYLFGLYAVFLIVVLLNEGFNFI